MLRSVPLSGPQAEKEKNRWSAAVPEYKKRARKARDLLLQ